MAVKSTVFWFVFGISALLAAPGAYAQIKVVKVRCGKQDKNRTLYETPDGFADLAIVKCGSKVQVLDFSTGLNRPCARSEAIGLPFEHASVRNASFLSNP
jgi:hypothetical protein